MRRRTTIVAACSIALLAGGGTALVLAGGAASAATTFGVAPYGPESSALNPVDTFLESAAHCHGSKVLSLVLSGFDEDGVQGCDSVKRHGGTVLVTPPASVSQKFTSSRGVTRLAPTTAQILRGS